MENAVMNVSIQIPLKALNSILGSKHPEMELQDHNIILFLIFKNRSHCFP